MILTPTTKSSNEKWSILSPRHRDANFMVRSGVYRKDF